MRHADAVTWFLSELSAETLADDSSEPLWTLSAERAARSVRREEPVIAPDAVGELIAGDSHVPFYLECAAADTSARAAAADVDDVARGDSDVDTNADRHGYTEDHRDADTYADAPVANEPGNARLSL